MKHLNPIPILLTLLFCSFATGISAQQTFPQAVYNLNFNGADIFVDSLIIVDGTDQAPCDPLHALIRPANSPYQSGFNLPDYEGCFNLMRGNGMKTMQVNLNYRTTVPAPGGIQYAWKMDGGAFNESGSVDLISHTSMGQDGMFYKYADVMTVTYAAGDSTDFPAVTHIFSLVPMFSNFDIRFKAVMIGANVSEPLGYYDTPPLPLYILHDPPGDLSYAEVANSTGACNTTGMEISTSNSESGFLKVKLGLTMDVGWIVETEMSVYVQGGISAEATQMHTTDMDIQTCLTSTGTFSTSPTGPPSDLFIGRATRYLYGVGKLVRRVECNTVIVDTLLVSKPIAALSTYLKTESEIRDEVIPGLQDSLFILESTVGVDDSLYVRMNRSLDAWHKTLALNDSIKAAAPSGASTAWSGGGTGISETRTLSSSTMRSITFTSSLSNGLSAEYGLDIGGTGVNIGGEVTFRKGYATNEASEMTNESLMHYYMADDDEGDQFLTIAVTDSTFGTFVFAFDSLTSRTSCPYEGGYQLDQPQLWVGQVGESAMTQDGLVPGTTTSYPIMLCNNGDYQRTYVLRVINQSNPNGAVISGYNGLSSSSTVSATIPPNTCLETGYVYLEQPQDSVLDFNNIQLVLIPECDANTSVFDDGDIASVISISAHFDHATGITVTSPTNGSFTVSPNPSAGRFDLVNADAGNGPVTVTVHDGLGRTVLPTVSFTGQPIMPIDLEGVAPGAYYLTATSAGQQQVLRVMVQQ